MAAPFDPRRISLDFLRGASAEADDLISEHARIRALYVEAITAFDALNGTGRVGEAPALAAARRADLAATGTALVAGEGDPGSPAEDAYRRELAGALRRANALDAATREAWEEALDAVRAAAPARLRELDAEQADAAARLREAVQNVRDALADGQFVATRVAAVRVVASGQELSPRSIRATGRHLDALVAPAAFAPASGGGSVALAVEPILALVASSLDPDAGDASERYGVGELLYLSDFIDA